MITRQKKKTAISRSFKALGTDVEVRIIVQDDEQDGESAKARHDLACMPDFYQRQEMVFSRFDERSELSKLNSQLGKACSVSPELNQVAALSLRYHMLSNGLFDPRILVALERIGYRKDFFTTEHVPQMTGDGLYQPKGALKQQLVIKGASVQFNAKMDFSGIAKGFITDKSAQYLRHRGWQDFLIDSGGDMYVAGRNLAGKDWVIAQEGVETDKIVIKASEQAIATSGISRRKWEYAGKRFHHLVNPKDPQRFLFDLRLVTVMARTVTEADVWAKVLFLMGRKQGLAYANRYGLKAIFLDYLGRVWISQRIKPFIRKG